MARRGIDTERERAAAVQGALRQIARGDRLDEAKLAIAALLEVPPHTFDVS